MKKYSFPLGNLRRISLPMAALALLLATGSCDVTDLQPSNVVSEETAYTDPARITLSVAGMYDAAQTGFYDALTGGTLAFRGYPFGAASTELQDMRGEDMVNTAGFFSIVYENTQTASSPNVVNMWSNCYAVINKANTVIEGVRKAGAAGIISPELALSYEGEARFLRALSHHELVLLFSRPYLDGAGSKPGVPYRDFAVNTVETVDKAKALDRGTVAGVYDKILEDLKFAEENLPATRSGGLRITHATKGAAIGLKTRVLLAQGKYDDVIAEGAKIISAEGPFKSPIGDYTLTPTPSGAFVTTNYSEDNKEAMFYIENSSADNPETNGALPSMFGSPSAAPDGNLGRGLIAVSPNIYKASFWLPTDLRKTTLLGRDANLFYTFKYKDAATKSDYTPLLRYAEVLLNVAEANARTGKPARALALLNAVRNRSVTTAADQYTATTFAGQTPLVVGILNERRIELLAEGKRWFDISRLAIDPDAAIRATVEGGVPAKVSRASIGSGRTTYASGTQVARTILGIPYSDNRFLWPIPAAEIANNPTLAQQQNPGY